MAAACASAGFEVSLKTNVDNDQMKRALSDFGATLKTKGGVGLFYFAGHGVQLKGENYLVPISKSIAGEIRPGG